MKGSVARLWLYDAASRSMREVSRANALADHGLEGCGHAQPGGKRQVLLIDEETLTDFALLPGAVKENVTTRGIRIQLLPAGSRVRVGGAVLETTGPCEPCGFMDTLRPGLREASMGKRGILACVKKGGEIKPGDGVVVLGASDPERVPR